MPRQARIIIPNIPHHITQRGNRREDVFYSDDDRTRYMSWLQEYCQQQEVQILAYCLMANHIHLVLVPSTNTSLEKVLRPLHTRYAQFINKKKGWKGHLWQGRYFSSALDEVYMWAAIRYVERNPVRAKIVRKAERYKWSSAAGHCGLSDDLLLSKKKRWANQFGKKDNWSSWLGEHDNSEQIRNMRKHFEKGLPCGSRQFIKKLEKLTGRELSYRPQGRPKKD